MNHLEQRVLAAQIEVLMHARVKIRDRVRGQDSETDVVAVLEEVYQATSWLQDLLTNHTS